MASGRRIRSSVAACLAAPARQDSKSYSFQIERDGDDVWFSLSALSSLMGISADEAGEHLRAMLEQGELDERQDCRDFPVGPDGSARRYSLGAAIALGFRARTGRAAQFRKWAGSVLCDAGTRGWALDRERLENCGEAIPQDYFDALLDELSEIRLSERGFFQKITDLYATAFDYDKDAAVTRRVYRRAGEGMLGGRDAEGPELDRILGAYLDLAEDRARRRLPLAMEDWERLLGAFLDSDGTPDPLESVQSLLASKAAVPA